MYDFQQILLITGKMKGLAFIKDPDGYWIEILPTDPFKVVT